MKKVMTMLACAVLSIGAASAQSTKTYMGFVVDKNGNPVVGAEVMSPGGGAATITDSDGSFKIEVPFMLKKLTASYAGMAEKTLKLGDSSNLVFKMKNLKKRTGFISIFGNLGLASSKYGDFENDKYFSYGGGLMGGQLGQLGNWGWYVKTIANFDDYDLWEAESLTAGAIRKLSKKAHLYFGAGGVYSSFCDSFGFSIDLGTIINVSTNINIIAGLNYSNTSSSDDLKNDFINLNIGVGYTF